jgi:hypothetical protein
MKVVAICAAAIGLCAVAEAGSIGFISSIIDSSINSQEQFQTTGLEVTPAELDYTMYSLPAAFLESETIAGSSSEQGQWSHEAPPILIILSGLGFIMLSGVLRVVPIGLRRLNAMRLERERRHARRRKVKVEIRMMA